jgi:folate-binding protein YgfZ
MVSVARRGSGTRAFTRSRSYVAVKGPDAADLLQRLLSNDVVAAESCEALILTPKGRVIAPLVVWRRGEEDFLLLTEPELGETVRSHLARMRFAAKCELALEEHTSTIVLGGAGGISTAEYGVPAVELLDADDLDPEPAAATDELERLRILARTPRWGHEIDETILPAEAGLDERAVSFTKGCFPGQEPVARLRNRGHANRSLRVLELEGELSVGDEIEHEGRSVGRVTSAVPRLALGYVRTEVPGGAEVTVAGQSARIH